MSRAIAEAFFDRPGQWQGALFLQPLNGRGITDM
jgi:hypothetical protein